MKEWMGWDEAAGSSECAILIFAPNHKEAKKMAFPSLQSMMDSEFVDIRVKQIKEEKHQHLLKEEVPQVIDTPPSCPVCEIWGDTPHGEICEGCQDDLGDEEEI